MPAYKKALSFLMSETLGKPCTGALAIFALALLFGPADLRAAAECSDTPAAGNWIECIEDSTSTSNIDINASSIDIDVSTSGTVGVGGYHQGSGNIDISVSGTTTSPSTIDVQGTGVYGRHIGGSTASDNTVTGTVTITLENTEITTTGGTIHHGVDAYNNSSGKAEVILRPGVEITASGNGVKIEQENTNTTTESDAILTTNDATIGAAGHGISVNRKRGAGNVRMDLRDTTVTAGDGHGIYGLKDSAQGNGDIDIDITGGSTTTNDYLNFGIYAQHHHAGGGRGTGSVTGDITIDLQDHEIRTEGTAHNPSLSGTYSYGIAAYHENSGGNIDIDFGEGSSIITKGSNSHGIVAYHWGTSDTRTIDITVDGTVTTEGADAQGIRVGTVSGSGVPSRMAALDAEGYRRHTVTVNGPITSTGEGVFLANGGKVVIGPTGQHQLCQGDRDSGHGHRAGKQHRVSERDRGHPAEAARGPEPGWAQGRAGDRGERLDHQRRRHHHHRGQRREAARRGDGCHGRNGCQWGVGRHHAGGRRHGHGPQQRGPGTVDREHTGCRRHHRP